MDKSKGFIDGELYVFVYQLDGVCLAHGLNGSWVGQNRLDWTDPDGRKPNKEMADQVKAGATSGFVDFKFKNPVSGNVEPKVAVFQRVPGKDFFIGSGVYRR
jgi:cytochrome c